MHTQQSGLVAPTSARSIGHQLLGTIKTYLLEYLPPHTFQSLRAFLSLPPSPPPTAQSDRHRSLGIPAASISVCGNLACSARLHAFTPPSQGPFNKDPMRRPTSPQTQSTACRLRRRRCWPTCANASRRGRLSIGPTASPRLVAARTRRGVHPGASERAGSLPRRRRSGAWARAALAAIDAAARVVASSRHP